MKHPKLTPRSPVRDIPRSQLGDLVGGVAAPTPAPAPAPVPRNGWGDGTTTP